MNSDLSKLLININKRCLRYNTTIDGSPLNISQMISDLIEKLNGKPLLEKKERVIEYEAYMVIAGQSNRIVNKFSDVTVPNVVNVVDGELVYSGGEVILTYYDMVDYSLILQFALWITRVHPNFVVFAKPEHSNELHDGPAFQLRFISQADFCKSEPRNNFESSRDIFTVHSGPSWYVPEKIAVPFSTNWHHRNVVRLMRWDSRKIMLLILYRGDPGKVWPVLSFANGELFRLITKFL